MKKTNKNKSTENVHPSCLIHRICICALRTSHVQCREPSKGQPKVPILEKTTVLFYPSCSGLSLYAGPVITSTVHIQCCLGMSGNQILRCLIKIDNKVIEGVGLFFIVCMLSTSMGCCKQINCSSNYSLIHLYVHMLIWSLFIGVRMRMNNRNV